MSDVTKICTSHLSRAAYVYLRQSTPAQVEHNRESTQRQYALAAKATALGWPPQQIVVIDEDLGLSGDGVVARNGFARLTAEAALRHVGIVLGLEVSRLARNNADWYRLLDLCGLTDTLIGDADGVYHPALFNDRLLLGLKGTMSEAELHILRARLLGGIRNKAARGELRRGLPVGFVWGGEDGEVRFHPDEAVCSAIRTVFARFAEFGSARRVWRWVAHRGFVVPTAHPLWRRRPLGRPQLHRRLSCADESGLRGRLHRLDCASFAWRLPENALTHGLRFQIQCCGNRAC
jgi:DNA invertase Pin-like site-specific DNA recombinase